MTSRRSGRRGMVAALLASLLVALFGLVQAQAAGLSLLASGTTWHVGTFPRTCSGPVTVTPSGTVVSGTYTQLSVTGLNSTCTGTGRVILRTSAGTLVVDGTAAASAGGFSVNAPAFTPPGALDGSVFVSVDTWPVAATWSAPASGSLGTCTVTSSSGSTTGKSCSIVTYSVADASPGAAVGSRVWKIGLTTGGSLGANQYAALSLDLGVVGLPSSIWPTAGVVNGNLTSATCAAPGLPKLQASAGSAAANSVVSFYVAENRRGTAGTLCP